MNRVIIALVAVSALSLSGLFASTAVAGNVHKTVVVHANGNVTKKFTSGHVHHHHHHGHNNGVILKSNGVILKTQNFGIRIGR